MFDRVSKSQKRVEAARRRSGELRLGRTTFGKCIQVCECLSGRNPQCFAAWIRPKEDGHFGNWAFSAMVCMSVFDTGFVTRFLADTSSYRLLFVLFNSLYSFYWDVAKDWDLTLFSPSHIRNSSEHPYGLRRHTHFHSKEMYYSAILIDLLLRCTWSLKLSPHLDHWNDLEGSIFVMEVLEVGRRWMWIFLRVETEWGKINKNILSARGRSNLIALTVRTNRGPAPDDILLGDYTDRDDDASSEYS